MSMFVESVKRLYKDQRISLPKLDELLKNNKITQEEYTYIKG